MVFSYSLCVWTRGRILRSVIWFFVFDNNTKRLVIKNREPCGLHLIFLPLFTSDMVVDLCSIVCVCVVAQESQASALRCLQDSLQKHNTTLTVTYSATLHDREIRCVDFTFWSFFFFLQIRSNELYNTREKKTCILYVASLFIACIVQWIK